jgi:hypothetical protein
VLSDGLPTAGAVTNVPELRRRVRDWTRFAQLRIHTVAIGAEEWVLMEGLYPFGEVRLQTGA